MKALVLLLVTFGLLFAGADRIRAQLIEYLALNLVDGREVVQVYITNERWRASVRPYLERVELVDSCERAQLIFATQVEEIPPQCRQKLIFLTSYPAYKRAKDSSIGALFWQKGRPNIIFNTRKITQLQIDLPDEFKKYME
ncbi:MAG: hypothetical protein C6I00_01715 [Nitratiruptor sp.]|nr:hypothetical protein [Nitratiruptor sp.]NPA83316.1 hypothetical protein [Campylobacterota bacterium]